MNSTLFLLKKLDEFHEKIGTLLDHLKLQVHEYDMESSTHCEASVLALVLSDLNSNEKKNAISHLKAQAHVFKPSVEQIQFFSIKVQKYLYDTMFISIDRKLKVLPFMEIWSNDAHLKQNASPFDLQIPQFSLSPLEYVTRIGEHLLSLPQQLDLYMDDVSLAYSISTLPFMSHSESIVSADPNDSMQDEEIQDITYMWITSVCRGTMDSYYRNAMLIPQLSSHGLSQLITDMQYLVNVFSAMDIQPMEQFKDLLDGLASQEIPHHIQGDLLTKLNEFKSNKQ